MSFIEGDSRDQISLLPACIDDYVAPDALVRVVDAFVASLDLAELGFNRAVAAATGRPGFQPGDMLRLYIWGYLNQVRSTRHRVVALDGTKMRAVASPKNIAGAERLARDIAHTERRLPTISIVSTLSTRRWPRVSAISRYIVRTSALRSPPLSGERIG